MGRTGIEGMTEEPAAAKLQDDIGSDDFARKPWQPYLEASLGFRNHWYAAFFSPQLAEGELRPRPEPVPATRALCRRPRLASPQGSTAGTITALPNHASAPAPAATTRPETSCPSASGSG